MLVSQRLSGDDSSHISTVITRLQGSPKQLIVHGDGGYPPLYRRANPVQDISRDGLEFRSVPDRDSNAKKQEKQQHAVKISRNI